MKFLSVGCILLALVATSYQAGSYCYNLKQFTTNLYDCLDIVMTAELDSLNEEAIDNYCVQINRGAVCIDSVVEGCSGAFDEDVYSEMKSSSSSLITDYEDICKELKEMGEDGMDERAVKTHAQRSTSTFNTLRKLHPFK